MNRTINGRGTTGVVAGEAIVTDRAFSFYADVSPEDGVFVTDKHGMRGESVAGKILVMSMPSGGIGSAWRVPEMKQHGVAPAALVMKSSNPVMLHASILAGIPLLSDLDEDPVRLLRTGERVTVDADSGRLVIG